jgi:hypothetical protein
MTRDADGAVLLGENREILWFNRTAGAGSTLRRKLDFVCASTISFVTLISSSTGERRRGAAPTATAQRPAASTVTSSTTDSNCSSCAM